MKYRNKKTGATINVAFAINGDAWELVDEKPKATKGDEIKPKVVEATEEPQEAMEMEKSKPKKISKTRSKKK